MFSSSSSSSGLGSGPGSGPGSPSGLDPQTVLKKLRDAIQGKKTVQQGFFQRLKDLNQQINDKIFEINTSISAKINSIQQKVQQINSQIGDFTTQIANNNQNISNINSQINNLANQIQQLEASLKSHKEQNQEIRDQITSKTDEVKLLQNQLLDLQEENAKLKQEIANTSTSTTNIQKQLENLTKNYNNVLQAIEQITNDLNNDDDFNNSSSGEITERQKLLDSLNQMSQNFLDQLNIIEIEVNAINDEQVTNVKIRKGANKSLSMSSGFGSFSYGNSTANGNTGAKAALNKQSLLQPQQQQPITVLPINPTQQELLNYLSQVQSQNIFDQVTQSHNFWKLPFDILQGKQVKILKGNDQNESYIITRVPSASNPTFNLKNTSNPLNNILNVPFQDIDWTEAAASIIKSGGKRKTRKTKKAKRRRYKYNKTAANKKRIKIYRGGFTYTTTTNPTTNPTTTNPTTTSTQERKRKTRRIKVKKSSHNMLGRTTARGLRR